MNCNKVSLIVYRYGCSYFVLDEIKLLFSTIVYFSHMSPSFL